MIGNKSQIKFFLFFFCLIFFNLQESQSFMIKNTDQHKLTEDTSDDKVALIDETAEEKNQSKSDGEVSFIDDETEEEEKLHQYEQSPDGKKLLDELSVASGEIAEAADENPENEEKSLLEGKAKINDDDDDDDDDKNKNNNLKEKKNNNNNNNEDNLENTESAEENNNNDNNTNMENNKSIKNIENNKNIKNIENDNNNDNNNNKNKNNNFLQIRKNNIPDAEIPEDDPRVKLEQYEKSKEGHELLKALSKVKDELPTSKQTKSKHKRSKRSYIQKKEVMNNEADDED